jgi:hypothetical protein
MLQHPIVNLNCKPTITVTFATQKSTRMFKTIALQVIALTFFAVASLHAQIKTPAPSPAAEVSQMVGLTDIDVVYSRPSMKGRTIFAADGLVPFGQLWRTGANRNTTIEFDKDVTIGGTALPKGKYAIFTKPMANQWEVFFYTDTNNGGTPREWDDKKVAAKLTTPVIKMSEKMENFTIMFDEITSNDAKMYMGWANTMVAVPIKVDTEKEALASIDRTLAGPTSRDYYQAATYYFENGKDLNQAYTWIKKANETDPKFWQLRRQSLIEAKLGNKTAAISTAKKSMELAKTAGNMDYVRLNEKSLKEWGAM